MKKHTVLRRFALGFAVVMLLVAAFAAMQAASVYQAAVSAAGHSQFAGPCISSYDHC